MQLPTTKSKPLANLLEYSMMLYGREKIGKTTLASMFPDALFLMCEPGGKSLEIFQVPVNTWKDLIEAIDLLAKDKRFKTVIIDTVDIAFNLCQDHVCAKLAISHPSEEDFGKGWSAVRDEFSRQMTRIQKLGKGIIFISHSVEKEIRRRSGEASHRVEPTLSKQGRGVLEPMVDVWAYYSYTPQGGRELIIRGDADVSAGCRVKGHFVGISRIAMGKSEEEAYRALMAAFNRTSEAPAAASASAKPKLVIPRRK